jgi:ABC-type multidrug transport system fused ATPase/permease subunit
LTPPFTPPKAAAAWRARIERRFCSWASWRCKRASPSSRRFRLLRQRSLVDLRCDTYARLISLPMTFFVQRRVGELAGRLSSDLIQIEDTLITILPQFLRQTTILIGGIALIAVTSLQLTGIMLASCEWRSIGRCGCWAGCCVGFPNAEGTQGRVPELLPGCPADWNLGWAPREIAARV